MKNRIKVYEKAKEKHPESWSKNIRNWELAEYVDFNPRAEEEVKDLLNKVINNIMSNLAWRTIDMKKPIR